VNFKTAQNISIGVTIVYCNKKLSYLRGTARRAMVVNSCSARTHKGIL